MKLFALIPFLFFAISVFGQSYTNVEDVDKLEEQEAVLKQTYPHLFKKASINTVIELDDSHSLVQYSSNGIYCESIVNSGRKDMLLLETSRAISKKDVPGPVLAATEDHVNGTVDIERQFVVDRPYGDRLYRIDLDDPDSDQIVTLYFDYMGHPAERPF